MKKIKDGIKKIFAIVGAFCISLYTKVLAMDPALLIEPMYGIPPEVGKKYKTIEAITGIWNIFKFFIIPIAFIIGAVVYFKKSSKSTLVKSIVIIVVLALILFECHVLNNIVENLHYW